MSTPRRRWSAGLCTLAAASALAVPAVAGARPAATHASARHAHHSAAFYARARRVLARQLRAALPPMLPAGPARPTKLANLSKGSSFNWAGYVDTSATVGFFTKVSGRWKVPAVTCTPEDRITSEWVGLDGANDNTVEQLGTVSQCFEGTAIYYSWYEMFPAGEVIVGRTVHPADAITASLVRTGTSYALKLTDATTSGNDISVTKTCAAATCTDTSAEWIVERPSFSTTGVVPLVEFDTPVNITNASATGGGTTGGPQKFANEFELSMIDSTSSYLLATPSALVTSNASFKTTWHNSY